MARHSLFITVVIPALAVAGLIGGVVTVTRHAPDRAAVAPVIMPPTQPQTVDASSGMIGAVGLVEAASEEVAIAAPISGVVTAIFVEPGSIVRRGDALFAIDPRQAQADLDVREAELASARARLAEASATVADLRDQLDRAERLNRMSQALAISEETLARRRFAVRTAEAKFSTTRAEIETAEAAVTSARVTLDRLQVRAPIDGTVLQRNLRAGEFAPANALDTPSIVLGMLTPLHLRVEIDEADLPDFVPTALAWGSRRGDAERRVTLSLVRVEPLVVPKRTLTGSGTERTDTRVLKVVYAFDPEALPAFPGQQMDVFIERTRSHAPAAVGSTAGK